MLNNLKRLLRCIFVKDKFKFIVINDSVADSFTVEGATISDCKLLADEESARRNWDKNLLRSEQIK